MGTYVTATGFKKKTLVEIKLELETRYQEIYGNDIDLSAEGPAGQMTGIASKRESDLWDMAEEIHTSRDPSQASGTSLDGISGETGINRIDATATATDNVICYGAQGTAILAGQQIKQTLDPLLHSLDTGIIITKAIAREVQVEPNTGFPLAGGEVFTVTIDAVPYTYNGIALDTKKIVIDELVILIAAGAWAGVSSNVNDDFLKLLDADADFAVLWTGTFDSELLGSGGDFVADETGVNIVPANTLVTIATPQVGWDSVNNPQAGTTGQEVETDTELRIRRAATFLAGNATDGAIKSALINEVPGVTSASVTSNRTMAVDGEGRPPKSFEAVVEGGTDLAVATQIWLTMPSGMESFGSTAQVVVDSEGNNQTINFSRPELMFLYVQVKRNFNTEETYPVNGDDLIKIAIVAYALATYNPGVDVIRGKLNIPVYTVPGIAEVEIWLDGIVDPGGAPAYLEQDIIISARQLADFDITRIVVVIL